MPCWEARVRSRIFADRGACKRSVRISSAALLIGFALFGAFAPSDEAQGQQPIRKVDMGDYEPVTPWPQPLPDTDLSHAGWTWGSGAGVWAETPDRVWVAQRGEIELPAGAEPWICACLINPKRTNTGRRDYSGKPYFFN